MEGELGFGAVAGMVIVACCVVAFFYVVWESFFKNKKDGKTK